MVFAACFPGTAIDAVPTACPQPSAAAPTIAAPPEPAGAPAEIVIQARPRTQATDPLAAVNAKSFAVTQSVDEALVGPVALTYKRTLPEPVRDGMRNFFKNLTEPVVALNYLLQVKPGKASETIGRLALNSTIGVGGLFDMARRHPFNLPRRPNGFAYTLGYYGVKSGPFLFLPLIGPTTMRDMIGGIADGLVLTTFIGFPFDRPAFTIPAGALGAVDRRAEFDQDLQIIRASADPYTARRDFYLRKRQREIDALHGPRKNAASTPPSKPVSLDVPNPDDRATAPTVARE
jgi:phospholipid-binding lipoprotein MlaA